MIDKHLLLAVLKPAHGLFNILVLSLFIYQAWKGILIRRARLSSGAIPFPAVRLHRKIGPIATMLAVAGYLAGISLVLFDEGHLFEHPIHLITGSLLILFLLAAFAVSRRIRAAAPSIRILHFRLGIITLTIFFVEVFLGLGILF